MIARIEIECLDCQEEFELDLDIEKGMHAVITDKIEKHGWVYVRAGAYDGYLCPECVERREEGPQPPDDDGDWREMLDRKYESMDWAG